jgi:hypothetical protein
MKVYISSTFTDLERHRATVGRKLRKAEYDVVMMEEQVARDERVEFACRGDVAACDVYVGIFAWRHGCVPEDDNPEALSITEMEYAAAGAKPMTRLTFLLDDKARWPKARKDADLTQITRLRRQLEKKCSAHFDNADDLAGEVLAALRVHENTQRTQRYDAAEEVLQAQELGPSFMPNIKEKHLSVLGGAEFVELHLAPTPWWNTRLYLVAALAQEFGRARGLVFIDGDGRFVLMASPSEIRHRLELRWPPLKNAYEAFRHEASTVEKVGDELWRYPTFVSQAFGTDEMQIKHALSVHDLAYELGIARDAEVIDVREKGQRFLQREILGRQTHYAALVRDHRLEGLVDRDALAQRVAQAALAHLP